MPDLAIVILNYNTRAMTLDCLKSLYRNPPEHSYEVWLVDNASSDDSIEQIRKHYPQVHIIANNANSGFACGNNLALKKIYKRFRFCLLLNTDTIILPKSFANLVDFADRGGWGIASCKLLFPDKRFQANTGALPTFIPVVNWLSGLDDIFRNAIPLPSYHQEGKKFYKGEKKVGWVSGSVMLISQKVFKKTGFLDEKIFMYGEDVDYCLRATKDGFNIGWTDSAEIIHIGGASSDKPYLRQWTGEFRGLFYVYRKHYGLLAMWGIKLISYFFILLRIIAFYLIGKEEHAKTYAQVIKSI